VDVFNGELALFAESLSSRCAAVTPEFELSPWFCLREVTLFASSQDFYAIMGKYAGDQNETKRIRALRNDASHCGLFSACHFQH
jgi:hypothetical protein